LRLQEKFELSLLITLPTKKIKINVTHEMLERVQRLTDRHERQRRQAEQARFEAAGLDLDDDDDPLGRAMSAELMEEARLQRALGKLLDTGDAVATLAVRRELQKYGLDPHHSHRPPKGVSARGRWPGAEYRGVPCQLPVNVPATYAAGATIVAWRISGRHIRQLRETFPHGRPLGPPEAVLEYQEIAQHVMTPGDIYRDALETLLKRGR